MTCLNNRACVVLEAGGIRARRSTSPSRPSRCAPRGAATRATALIAIGRFDDAIGVLEGMRAGGELSPALEVMRCREIACAWDHKGQPDDADDDRDRARRGAR